MTNWSFEWGYGCATGALIIGTAVGIPAKDLALGMVSTLLIAIIVQKAFRSL
jgi:hypothetical protein